VSSRIAKDRDEQRIIALLPRKISLSIRAAIGNEGYTVPFDETDGKTIRVRVGDELAVVTVR
jgi:hypothetical protein